MSDFAEALEGVAALIFGGIVLLALASELEPLSSTSVGSLGIILFIGGLILGVTLLAAAVGGLLRR